MSFLSNFQLVASNEVLINEAISTDTTAPEISNASDALFCEVMINTDPNTLPSDSSNTTALETLKDADPLYGGFEILANASPDTLPSDSPYTAAPENLNDPDPLLSEPEAITLADKFQLLEVNTDLAIIC